MKINEIEKRTGITKANIRYYESQGLITPDREPNGYRTYTESHINELLRIKLLRTLGIPIESIKSLCDGKVTLEQTLSDRKEKFQGQHQELDLSEKIIGMMLDSQMEFGDINPEDYLIMMAGSADDPIKKDVNTKPILPWRRMWARSLDFTVYNLILYVCAPSLFQTEGFNPFLILAEIAMLVVFEPVLLCLFYTTPGKLIFGITVTSLDGKRLSYREALDRTMLVLQHGLGFCAPFLKEYMQYNSLSIAESGETLIWEHNSELNIKDAKIWRYFVFFAVFLAAMAYPAKMEFVRIFSTDEITYSGETPFIGDYKVEQVIYPVDADDIELPIIRLVLQEMSFSYDKNTAGSFEPIGTFGYAPPNDDPTVGLWELQTGSVSDTLYQLRIEENEDILLDCYENFELQWSWKLKRLDIIDVEFKNNITTYYTAPEWFEEGIFDGNIDILRPRRPGSDGTITLIFRTEVPDSIVIEEEIHRGTDVKIRQIQLNKNQYGRFSIEYEPLEEADFYILYRVPYEDGSFLFCVVS